MSKTLKHIRIEFSEGMEIKQIFIEEVEIAAENEKYLVLNDPYFTKLQKSKSKGYNIYTPLDHVTFSDHFNDKTMSRILFSFCAELYTTASIKVAENKINRELNKYLKEKLSVYGSGKTVKVRLEDK